MHTVFSSALAAFGLVSLYLVGRPCRTRRERILGAALGIVDELLWIAYAVVTAQYAFVLSGLAYGWVYVGQLRACWVR